MFQNPIHCDRCEGELKPGIAINSAEIDDRYQALGGPAAVVDHETIGFITVMKCKECGRSLSEQEIRDFGFYKEN